MSLDLLLLVGVDLVHAVVVAPDVVDGHHKLEQRGPESQTSHEGEDLSEHAQPTLAARHTDLRDVLRQVEVHIDHEGGLLLGLALPSDCKALCLSVWPSCFGHLLPCHACCLL